MDGLIPENHDIKKYMVGTVEGFVYQFELGFWGTTQTTVNDKALGKGPIKKIAVWAFGFCTWATPTGVFIKHLKRAQNITYANRPKLKETFNQAWQESNLALPSLNLRADSSSLNPYDEPNASVYIGWIYMIKKIVVTWKDEENKFAARC